MEEKENNKEKTKQKSKRNISILTVFLWLTLIAVMSVITISGIVKNNALESDREIITRTLKIDFSEIFENEGISSEEEIEKVFKEYSNKIRGTLVSFYTRFDLNYTTPDYFMLPDKDMELKYIGKENNTVGIYELKFVAYESYIFLYIDDLTLKYSLVDDDEKEHLIVYGEKDTIYYSGVWYNSNRDNYNLSIKKMTQWKLI